MPRKPRSIAAPFFSFSTIGLAVSDGIAKPIPMFPPAPPPDATIQLLMPITLPAMSNIGPPELPELIEASVWM